MNRSAYFLMFICVLLLLPGFCPLEAQDNSRAAPILINYQGVLKDPAGNPLSGTYDMVFRIYTQQSGGNYDWQEVHAVVDAVPVDSEGVFNVLLNSTGTAAGDLAMLLRTQAALWLEIEVQGETLAPRQRLTSSGYALSSPWSGLTGVPSGFSDDTDDIGFPGIGLDESAGTLSIEPSYRLPQSASNGQVAKWNSSTSQWEPGDDQGTNYSAGDGVILTGSTFSVNFTGSGSATTVSRSDHHHIGDSWSGFANPGLSVETTSTTSGATAIIGKATGDTDTTGVHGESTSSVNGSIGLSGLASGSTGISYGVYGETRSNASGAIGVCGKATGGSLSSPGVYGETNATEGAGVYGKNTSPAGYGVYSEGHSKVDGDLTITGDITLDGDLIQTTPQTGIVTLTAAAFYAEKNSVAYINDGMSWERTDGIIRIDYEKEAYANVTIPHGVTLTKVTVYGYTDSPIGMDFRYDFLLTLHRTPLDETKETMVFIVDEYYDSVPGQTHFSYETTDIDFPEIDNSTYGYYLRFAAYQNAKLHGVKIEYTY